MPMYLLYLPFINISFLEQTLVPFYQKSIIANSHSFQEKCSLIFERNIIQKKKFVQNSYGRAHNAKAFLKCAHLEIWFE